MNFDKFEGIFLSGVLVAIEGQGKSIVGDNRNTVQSYAKKSNSITMTISLASQDTIVSLLAWTAICPFANI